MEKTKQKELKGKQFRWSSPMERLMLKVLAEEASKGNKPSSRFKHGSLEKAAKAISEKFHVDCVPDHVENRLKTVKKTWTTITTLKEKAGFSWDANSRMVIAGKDEFDEEVSVHPSYEKLLNKKIEMYDEMALVVGKDFTPGCFAKSVCDIDMDDNKVDSVHVEEESSSAHSIQAAPSIQATPRKRNHSSISEGDQIKELSKQIGKMAKALKVLSENQFVDVKKLFEEVMKCEGFSDNVLGSAFDFLVENEKQAKAFMVKTMNLRKSWLEGFESRMKN